MEKYDILMLVILLGAMMFGAVKGFAWQLASIGSIVASYIVAYRFREPLSLSIQAEAPWNRFLAMLILYIGTSLVIWMAFRMISQTIDRLKLKEFDRQVGAIFGLAKGCLYCILVTLFAVTLLGPKTRSAIVASSSGRYIAKVLDQSESVIPPEIHQVVGPYLEKFERSFDASSQPQDEGLRAWARDVTEGVATQAEAFLPQGMPSPPGTPSPRGTPLPQSTPWNGPQTLPPQQAERLWPSAYSGSQR